ncbi:GNAT family N-acetyltransferase [Aeromicrobium sp. PE09-221]|uniref:GNAT family N-acetyltransferase n=1 Tax=Aeromicrobium sp. PE09-221 TaxID=1898043 RepID=UPI000B3EB906|nr:GNAT family N-acetyltransferase [Aeromicrobium sp. PE09-221]OUZ12139.1 GNAT family N-acetyltransferase [Aeromicrobium sp. PE09-221]
MIALSETPRLVEPTTAVRISYLTGEQADMRARGSDTSWLTAASTDFDGFVADRVGVRQRWGVPSTLFWFVSGEHYLGTLVVRHRLTEDQGGGHIGYHVVQPWQHRGHATRMLAQGLVIARSAGVDDALLTVDPANEWSRRVIIANGGAPEEGLNHEGEQRFWIRS